MIFTSEEREGITIVNINLSRATMDSAPQFRTFLLDIIEKNPAKIIANLSSVDFLDSSFLGALVFGLKKIIAGQGKMKVVIAKEAPSGIMSLTKMDQVFQIYKDLDEAIESFNDN